jgi:large subunit ribosomal protein L10e
MARKPGSMYRYVRGQLSTRKEYMGGIPNSRITQFVMGNKKDTFPVKISLIVKEQCQVRHTALEASRIAANRTMDKKVGVTNYRIRVRVYPHVVLRENKQATGAGADRVSQGMRSSFGKIVSTAANIRPNQTVIDIETYPEHIKFAKAALRKAGMKIPSPCRVIIHGEN